MHASFLFNVGSISSPLQTHRSADSTTSHFPNRPSRSSLSKESPIFCKFFDLLRRIIPSGQTLLALTTTRSSKFRSVHGLRRIVDLQWIPSTVQKAYLSSNFLNGTIGLSTSIYPSGTKKIDIRQVDVWGGDLRCEIR